jgi:hypothetical protein
MVLVFIDCFGEEKSNRNFKIIEEICINKQEIPE